MKSNNNLKNLPTREQPYERLERVGSKGLSDAELIAIILRTGCSKSTAIELAREILKLDINEIGLSFLHDISTVQLMKLDGIGRVKSLQILALCEIAKRMSERSSNTKTLVIKGPKDIAEIYYSKCLDLYHEILELVVLDKRGKLQKMISLSSGGIDSTIFDVKYAFQLALKYNASSVILIHNHPSGYLVPGIEDISMTSRAIKCGELLGIPVSDHIIIGKMQYYSMRLNSEAYLWEKKT